MPNEPMKCSAAEFRQTPFYVMQTDGNSKRYVVSLRDIPNIKKLLTTFINAAPNPVQIKIRDFDDLEHPVDYVGSVNKAILLPLMTQFEEVIFGNGFHDLMLRNAESEEYVVFDEHELIFIYTDIHCAPMLQHFGAEFLPDEKLTYEYCHFHISIPNGPQRLLEFVAALQLEKE